jgi:hypothetical protein
VVALTVPLMLPTPADAITVNRSSVNTRRAAPQQSTWLIRRLAKLIDHFFLRKFPRPFFDP